MRPLATIAVLSLALVACGDPEPGVSEGSAAPAPTNGPVEVVRVVDDVEYYGACGNETLVVDGTTWYPVNAFEDVYADVTSVARIDPLAPPRGFAPRVAPPGPGDDVGTLVVWADGVARFVSDSGEYDVWLIDDELTYGWDC